MRSLLIRDTTRQEREEIVRRALSACGGSCDGCNGCGNSGGGRIETIYQPYIDGEKELSQINEEYSASRGLIRLFSMARQMPRHTIYKMDYMRQK